MNDQEILKKAIEKAINNGFDKLHIKEFGIDSFADLMMGSGYALAGLLHSHDFARAFWGEEKIRVSVVDKAMVSSHNPISDKASHTMVEVTHLQSAWRAHLQQIVLYENPIKYLEQFI